MSNEKGIVTYEITPLTMAILSKVSENGHIHSHVMEEEFDYTVYTTPTKIIDYACKFYGSSLKGRLDGTLTVSNLKYKPPITIEPSSGMYYFPTVSPTSPTCSWIAHSQIHKVEPIDQGRKTEIIFKNGKRIQMEISYGSMINQQQRTAQYRYSLDKHMELIANALSTQDMIAEK